MSPDHNFFFFLSRAGFLAPLQQLLMCMEDLKRSKSSSNTFTSRATLIDRHISARGKPKLVGQQLLAIRVDLNDDGHGPKCPMLLELFDLFSICHQNIPQFFLSLTNLYFLTLQTKSEQALSINLI